MTSFDDDEYLPSAEDVADKTKAENELDRLAEHKGRPLTHVERSEYLDHIGDRQARRRAREVQEEADGQSAPQVPGQGEEATGLAGGAA